MMFWKLEVFSNTILQHPVALFRSDFMFNFFHLYRCICHYIYIYIYIWGGTAVYSAGFIISWLWSLDPALYNRQNWVGSPFHPYISWEIRFQFPKCEIYARQCTVLSIMALYWSSNLHKRSENCIRGYCKGIHIYAESGRRIVWPPRYRDCSKGGNGFSELGRCSGWRKCPSRMTSTYE
jgi:hypothetical protein